MRDIYWAPSSEGASETQRRTSGKGREESCKRSVDMQRITSDVHTKFSQHQHHQIQSTSTSIVTTQLWEGEWLIWSTYIHKYSSCVYVCVRMCVQCNAPAAC